MKLRLIRFVLCIVRTLRFEVTYCTGSVMTYVWERDPDSGAVRAWFESPNNLGERELYPICCVLRMDGFWFLIWQILAHSYPLTGTWRYWEGREPRGLDGAVEMSCKCTGKGMCMKQAYGSCGNAMVHIGKTTGQVTPVQEMRNVWQGEDRDAG